MNGKRMGAWEHGRKHLHKGANESRRDKTKSLACILHPLK